MNRTLFELSEEILNVESILGTLDDNQEDMVAVIHEYLEGIESDLNIKIDNYTALICELESRSAARKEESERLAHRAKVDQNLAARLKECLKWYFQTRSLKVVETRRYRLTLCANGGRVPILLSVPTEQLPSEYVLETVSLKPDMDAIRSALENGKEIPGADIGERSSNIRIS